MYNITVADIYDRNLKRQIDSLPFRPSCRLVVDECVDEVLEIYKILSPHTYVYMQVVDSARIASLSKHQWHDRLKWFSDNFPATVRMEVSNECNATDWTGPEAWDRSIEAADAFKAHPRSVTLFYQDGVVDFWEKNKIEGVDAWLSFYPTNVQDVLDAPSIIKQLGVTEIGETGMDDWKGKIKPTVNTYKQILAFGLPTNFWDWQTESKLISEL